MAGSNCSRRRDDSLPSYLAHHMSLGFDSDDVAALVDSIDSSQDPQGSKLPHLPAEILIHILEFVPIDYLLAWRLVCRGFRDAIDGPVLYQLLKRVELIGYLGPHGKFPLKTLSLPRYDQIRFIRARFEQVYDPVHTPEDRPRSKWDHNGAMFAVDDDWFERLGRIRDQTTKDGVMKPAWINLLYELQLFGNEDSPGVLLWCLKLDKAVMDLSFSLSILLVSVVVDLGNDQKRIMVDHWKDFLFDFLKTETQLRLLTDRNRDAVFTFGLQQDCLRAVRRERLRAVLDLDLKDHRLVNWEINMLCPLFGRPRYDKASTELNGLESIEDDATATLIFLRKEAGMSMAEAAYLKQLVIDQSAMQRDLETINGDFAEWKSLTFGVNTEHDGVYRLPSVPLNPIAWSDEVIAREESRIKVWKSQRKLIEQLGRTFNASIEAMSLPEDAFDDSEYDL